MRYLALAFGLLCARGRSSRSLDNSHDFLKQQPAKLKQTEATACETKMCLELAVYLELHIVAVHRSSYCLSHKGDPGQQEWDNKMVEKDLFCGHRLGKLNLGLSELLLACARVIWSWPSHS